MTEVGARSVAFSAVSTGIFGYPLDDACRIAVETVRGADIDLDLVCLVAFDDRTLTALQRAVG